MTDKPKILNLTPHPIDFSSGLRILPEPAPYPRVAELELVRQHLDHFDLVALSPGRVTGLPDPSPGTLLITSRPVAMAARRPDVVCPHDLIRDAQGRIIGCKALAYFTGSKI